MIDEIGNVLSKQVIAPINMIIDENSENAKSGNSDQSVEEKTTKTVLENG